jgi:hypothetical protein
VRLPVPPLSRKPVPTKALIARRFLLELQSKNYPPVCQALCRHNFNLKPHEAARLIASRLVDASREFSVSIRVADEDKLPKVTLVGFLPTDETDLQ